MRTLTLGAALAAAAMLIVSPVFAQTPQDCSNQPSASPGASGRKAPAKLEGQVTKIDHERGTLTVQTKDGTVQEFRGSKETVKDYKLGDQIELTLRSEPCR